MTSVKPKYQRNHVWPIKQHYEPIRTVSKNMQHVPNAGKQATHPWQARENMQPVTRAGKHTEAAKS